MKSCTDYKLLKGLNMADRFDLETNITNLYNVTEDLDLLLENILEYDLAVDDAANAILGIRIMLDLRLNKLFETYKAVFELDNYSKKRPEHKDAEWTKNN